MPVPNLEEPVLGHARSGFTPLHVGQSVAEALAHLRATPPRGRVVYFYLVDRENRLAGVVPARLLLLSALEAPLETIMIPKPIAIPSTATVKDAFEMFTTHKFLAFPVVDSENHFLGVVDIELYTQGTADLARRTRFDDLFQLLGMHLAKVRSSSPLGAFRQRFPWLLCNVGGGILAALLSGAYQGVLDRLIVLALFIPVVLSLSESVSVQSVSLAIQLAHGERSSFQSALRAIWKEAATGLLLGLGCGFLVGLAEWIWKGHTGVALTIMASITVGLTMAALVGMALPIGLRLLRRDPKVAAGPIALMFADLFTLLIYFNVALFISP